MLLACTTGDLKVLLAPQETEMCYWHHISFGSDTGTRNENIATGTIFRCIKKYNYSLVYEGQLNCEKMCPFTFVENK